MESPLVFVIFGATGDLMARKLMPAIYSLYKRKDISQNLFIVGVGRRELTNDQFRELMAQAVRERFSKGAEVATSVIPDPPSVIPANAGIHHSGRVAAEVARPNSSPAKRDDLSALPAATFDLSTWGNLIDGMYYEQGFFEDPALYDRIVATLSRFDEAMAACVPRYFYLATPPQHYETILTHLKTSTLSEGCGQGTINFTRVLIEKPFGKDLETARNLDKLLAATFEEKQIYRIDHYLGKETVQNILALRFANGIFEPTWNNEFIDHVQITLAEKEGVGSRGAFYDGVGALRDVLQNHMLQMLALIAMEQPHAFDATAIRDERARVLQAIRPIEPKDVSRCVVRGQYEGYLGEKGVDAHSQTETYAMVKLELVSKRWKGVPFYLRTGKKLAKEVTEIAIHYKKPAVCFGDACLFPEKEVLRNVLSIRIQPDDGITLRLMVKEPGLGMKLASTSMMFRYTQAFPDFNQPEAYEKVFLDAIRGDQTLFARTDGIEASWKLVTNILEGWSAQGGSRFARSPLWTYKPGSMGPKEADACMEKDNRHWFLQENHL